MAVKGLSMYAECITEIILFCIEMYIPHSFSYHKPSKHWFNSVCSGVIYDKEVAHKQYLSLPSSETHVLYISVQINAEIIFQ